MLSVFINFPFIFCIYVDLYYIAHFFKSVKFGIYVCHFAQLVLVVIYIILFIYSDFSNHFTLLNIIYSLPFQFNLPPIFVICVICLSKSGTNCGAWTRRQTDLVIILFIGANAFVRRTLRIHLPLAYQVAVTLPNHNINRFMTTTAAIYFYIKN